MIKTQMIIIVFQVVWKEKIADIGIDRDIFNFCLF